MWHQHICHVIKLQAGCQTQYRVNLAPSEAPARVTAAGNAAAMAMQVSAAAQPIISLYDRKSQNHLIKPLALTFLPTPGLLEVLR